MKKTQPNESMPRKVGPLNNMAMDAALDTALSKSLAVRDGTLSPCGSVEAVYSRIDGAFAIETTISASLRCIVGELQQWANGYIRAAQDGKLGWFGSTRSIQNC